MLTRKKLTAVASAFVLSGSLALATPTAMAQEDGSSISQGEGTQPGSSEGEGTQPGTPGSSEGEGEGEQSSFEDFKNDLSSEDYKEENGTSSDAQKWVLGVGIVGAVLALLAAVLPQVQQFLPKF